MYDLLVTCLTQAESDLLYVRTTQNYDSPASGSGSGGGKNKMNGKQINQTAGSKKQQGNGGNSNGSNGSSNSGPPKQQRKCPYCASTVASHGHVLECRKIENVPAEMLYK